MPTEPIGPLPPLPDPPGEPTVVDKKLEIGDNLRSTIRDILQLLTLIVSIWAAAKSTTASNNAQHAVNETLENNGKIAAVSQEVKKARNDARKVFGLAPVPTDAEPQ